MNLFSTYNWPPFFSKLKILVAFCFVFGCSKNVSAQIVNIPEPDVDSTYIDLNYDTWSLRAYGVLKYHNLVALNNSGQKVKYVPLNPYSLGLGFAYRFIIMDLGFRINKDNKLSRLDFIANLVFKKTMIEIVAQRYEGFQETIGTSKEYFRDDIKSTLISISDFYNFKNKKLSLSSTFTGNKVQKKSTGTFLIGGFLSYSKIESDSSFIPEFIDGAYSNRVQFTKLSMLNIGVYFGYAYSLVLPKNFIFFSNLCPGLGFSFAEVQGSENYAPPVFPVGKLNFRASFGHYSKKFYVILGLTTNLTLVPLGDRTRFRQNGGQIKLVFGYRFHSKNPLTKTIDKTF